MEITFSRKTVIGIFAAVIAVVAALAILFYSQSSRTAGSVVAESDLPASDSEQLLAETVRIAEGIGTGDFYLHPENYPLSDELKDAFARAPKPPFLPYLGAVGHPVILLSTKDFVDTAHHVSFKQNGRNILTQVQLRFQMVKGKWTVVNLRTYARGELP
jgi:hypothetical protein